MAKYFIEDKRVIKFYDDNPGIDFQDTNKTIVSLLEQSTKSTDNNFISNSLSQIMNDMETQRAQFAEQQDSLVHNKNEIGNFKENINSIQSTIASISNNQLKIQSDLVNNMREIVNNNSSMEQKSISDCIQTQFNSLNHTAEFDRLRLLIDNVSKSVDSVKQEQHDAKVSFDNQFISNIREIMENKFTRTEKQIQDNILSTFNDFFSRFNDSIKSNNSTLKQISYDDNKSLISQFISEYKSSSSHDAQQFKISELIDNTIKQNISESESRLTANINIASSHGLETKLLQQQMGDELHSYLKKYENSSKKGEMSENRIEPILNNLFSNAEVLRTADETAKGDFILKRADSPDILIENKNYSHNVQKKEIDKFKRDISIHKIPGIMFSQESGIACKQNYEFEIYLGKYPLLYLHNVSYDPNTIKQSIDLIDHLYKIISKIDTLNTNNDQNINIPHDVIASINQEYKDFASTIDNLKTIIKQFQRQTDEEISKIKLPSLDKFLTGIYPTNTDVNISPNLCPICKVFISKNKKGLATHKNACKRTNDPNKISVSTPTLTNPI